MNSSVWDFVRVCGGVPFSTWAEKIVHIGNGPFSYELIAHNLRKKCLQCKQSYLDILPAGDKLLSHFLCHPYQRFFRLPLTHTHTHTHIYTYIWGMSWNFRANSYTFIHSCLIINSHRNKCQLFYRTFLGCYSSDCEN